MGRYTDNTGVDHTCPLIDEVISAIKVVKFDDDDWHTNKSLIEIMEKIRTMNDALRTFGNSKCKDSDEYENQISDLEKKISDLESGNEYYQSEIEKHETTIDQLQDEIYELKHN